MEKLQEFFEYLLQHPGALKLLGIILVSLFTFPYIMLAARIRQIRKIRKAYDDLISDQTTTITSLYRNIMEVQGNLAKTRGELDQKIAQLKNKNINLDEALENITKLKVKIKLLEAEKLKLTKRIKEYEGIS